VENLGINYIQGIIQEKKEAHLKYIQLDNDINRNSYKILCAVVRRETRRIYRESLDKYRSSIERDVHGDENIACKIMKKVKKRPEVDLQLNIISKGSWITYFKNLWTHHVEEDMKTECINEICDFYKSRN
jgi:hypothetical protein